jgi:Homoserine dehydrogenase
MFFLSSLEDLTLLLLLLFSPPFSLTPLYSLQTHTEAQDLGYAEADPTADVEGHDVQAKIALLAKLAFG